MFIYGWPWIERIYNISVKLFAIEAFYIYKNITLKEEPNSIFL